MICFVLSMRNYSHKIKTRASLSALAPRVFSV
jgi:hypothetical protein